MILIKIFTVKNSIQKKHCYNTDCNTEKPFQFFLCEGAFSHASASAKRIFALLQVIFNLKYYQHRGTAMRAFAVKAYEAAIFFAENARNLKAKLMPIKLFKLLLWIAATALKAQLQFTKIYK